MGWGWWGWRILQRTTTNVEILEIDARTKLFDESISEHSWIRSSCYPTFNRRSQCQMFTSPARDGGHEHQASSRVYQIQTISRHWVTYPDPMAGSWADTKCCEAKYFNGGKATFWALQEEHQRLKVQLHQQKWQNYKLQGSIYKVRWKSAPIE